MSAAAAVAGARAGAPAPRVEVLHAPDDRWLANERARLAAGLSVPLPHRHAWAVERRPTRSVLVALDDAAGRPLGAAVVELAASRALPGFRIGRVERLGASGLPSHVPALAAALRDTAHALPRLLRLHAEVVTREPAVAAAWADALAAAGFRPAATPRIYDRTLVLDLAPGEDALLRGFSKSTRRDVRVTERLPLAVRPIDDPALAPRLHALMAESFARTGAAYVPVDWPGIMAFSARHPALSRLVGLFHVERTGPEALLGLAWSGHHGDHAHYDAGASTRHTDVKAGIAYPLLWDVVRWAAAHGARWFDFGGVTRGSVASDDALGGISDFKRAFTKDVVRVGQEWVYEPSTLLARTAESLGGLARRVARLRGAAAP